MTSYKKLALFLLIALSAATTTHAQLEVTQLIQKGQSATGVGAFLHFIFPVAKGDAITAEAGVDYFSPSQSHLVFVPLLVGYRHTFNHTGTGFYAEPFAGYSIGATDIQKIDAHGNPEYTTDGSEIDEDLSGPTAGLGIGYIVPSARLPINFGLRFGHTFVSGTPSPSMLSFRISWSVLTGRHLAAQ